MRVLTTIIERMLVLNLLWSLGCRWRRISVDALWCRADMLEVSVAVEKSSVHRLEIALFLQQLSSFIPMANVVALCVVSKRRKSLQPLKRVIFIIWILLFFVCRNSAVWYPCYIELCWASILFVDRDGEHQQEGWLRAKSDRCGKFLCRARLR